MIALRREIHAAEQARGPVWLQRVRQGLNPRVVGGIPIEDFVPGPPTCPACGRQWTVADVEDAWFHIKLPMPCAEKPVHERRNPPDFSHGRDRRRSERRAA